MTVQRNKVFSILNEALQIQYFWFRKIDGRKECLSTALHRHTFFEMHYVLKGGNRVTAQEQEFWLTPGQWVIFPENTLHQIFQTQEDTEKIVFGFNVSGPLRLAFKQVLTNVQCFTQTDCLQKLQNLYFACSNSPVDMGKKANLLPCFFLEILTILDIENVQRAEVSSSDLFDQMVKYIDDYIEQEDITVESLARQFLLSTRHLARIFHQFTGLSPGQYLTQRKIDLIKMLLESPKHTLDDIAYICRFSGASSMIRFFKDHEGITPTKYRQKFTQKKQ